VIVVTGSSGFVGTNLVTHLVGAGHDVVGIDRRPPSVVHGAPTQLTELSRSSRTANRLLADAAAVVHLAARPGVRACGPGIEHQRWRDNVLASRRVVSAMDPAAQLVVTSSSSVYGGARRARPCREDQPLDPIGGYAESKVLTEIACRRHTGPTCVLRPFTIVGEHQRSDMALARWIALAERGESLTVYGALDRTRDLTDVAAVVRAIAIVLERATVGTLNVGTGTGITLGECVEAVRATVRDVPVRVVPSLVDEPDDTLADTTRCAAALGFVPTTSLRAVIERQWRASTMTSVA
jgi:nucleoside-diphosphate-sugar epimerase